MLGVYLYEYMDEWEKKQSNETTLPEEKEIYNKDFEIKHLGQYHDLYLKIDTLLLADVFVRKLQKNVFKYSSFRSC